MSRGLLPGLVPVLAALCALVPGTVAAHSSAGIVVDKKGQVFFTDNGGDRGSLWKIDAEGRLTRLQEGGWHWLVLDEEGRYSGEDLKAWFEKRITMNFGRVPVPDSKGALLQADGAPAVIDRDGNICWGNLEIKRLSRDGKTTLVAPAIKETAEKLGGIKGLTRGPDGSLYATCPSAVLRIQPDETVTTVIHPIQLEDADWNMPADAPDQEKPGLRGVAVDSGGRIYVAATGGRRVLEVSADAKVKVVMKSEPPWAPTGIATREEDVYVLEYTHANGGDQKRWTARVRKLARDGKVTTMATVPEGDRSR